MLFALFLILSALSLSFRCSFLFCDGTHLVFMGVVALGFSEGRYASPPLSFYVTSSSSCFFLIPCEYNELEIVFKICLWLLSSLH